MSMGGFFWSQADRPSNAVKIITAFYNLKPVLWQTGITAISMLYSRPLTSNDTFLFELTQGVPLYTGYPFFGVHLLQSTLLQLFTLEKRGLNNAQSRELAQANLEIYTDIYRPEAHSTLGASSGYS